MSEIIYLNTGSAVLAGECAGTGHPLIFLHAGVADRRMWQPQLADLGASYQVVAYDRRGFGETRAPNESFSQVEDLRAVLEQLRIGAATLIGCSQGGRVAIDFALTYPQRTAALVLIAPAVSGAPGPAAFPPEIQALDDALDAADGAGDLERVNQLEAHVWLDGPTSPEGRVSGAIRELFLDMNGIALRMPELTQVIEPASAYKKVSTLSMPALVLWGELDFLHIRERCRYLVETLPDARGEEIPGCAHLPNLEKPELVNGSIRNFLKRTLG